MTLDPIPPNRMGPPRLAHPVESLRTPEPPMLTINEVAHLPQVSTRTVQRMVKKNQFPRPKKVSGSCRWRAAVVHAWIATDPSGSTSDPSPSSPKLTSDERKNLP